MVTLDELKSHAKPGGPLEKLQVVRQSRLSVTAVSRKQWKFILGLAGEEPEGEQRSEKSGDEKKAEDAKPAEGAADGKEGQKEAAAGQTEATASGEGERKEATAGAEEAEKKKKKDEA